MNLYGYNYLALRDSPTSSPARLKQFSRIRNVDPNSSGAWYERDREFEYFLDAAPGRPGRVRAVREGPPRLRERRTSGGSAPGGALGGQVHVGDREYPLAVKLAGYQDLDVRGLEGLRVRGAGSREAGWGTWPACGGREVLARIVREDQQYQRTVAWEFRGPRKLGDLVRDAVLDAMRLPPGYRIEKEDPFRLSSEQKGEVYLALGFAVLLIYMVTAALFESLAAPFVVLLTLPLALIGVFLIFFYTDASFTRTAYIGTIMMAGIVVNNAILVVYHIGELREREGLGPARRSCSGTLERVRPILMTTFTTIFGLLPLVLFARSRTRTSGTRSPWRRSAAS